VGSVALAGLVLADEALAAPVDLEDKAEGSVAPAGLARLMVAAVPVEAALPIDHKVTKSLKRRIDLRDYAKRKTPGLERTTRVPGVFWFFMGLMQQRIVVRVEAHPVRMGSLTRSGGEGLECATGTLHL
jgi:hypothetical protein